MKHMTPSTLLFLLAGPLMAQGGATDRTDDTLGFRKPMRGTSYTVYESTADRKPEKSKYRTLDHRTYVRRVECPECKVTLKENGADVTYVLVHIPGVPCLREAIIMKAGEDVADQRMGRGADFNRCPECEALLRQTGGSINRCHYNTEVWIQEEHFNTFQPEYLAGRNVPTIGLLTLPWIYRFERGDAPPILDGGFSISAALGWKFRVSPRQGMSLFPIVAPGIRSLNYSAANNTALEGDASETGSAITLAGGLIFEWEKKQVGIVLGTDTPLGDLGQDFVYGGAPWLAFTIGFDLYTRDKDAKGPENK